MNDNRTKYKNSFAIQVNFFENNQIRYLDSHGKVVDEPYYTSLIASYKAIIRFLGKRRRRPFSITDHTKDTDKPNLNEEGYELYGLMAILFNNPEEGHNNEAIRSYWVIRSKEELYACLEQESK